MKCWICGNTGDTREHIIKSSDLKRQFGVVRQDTPLYFHTEKSKNIPIGSLKSKRLKSNALICNHCNSSVTQLHDRSWENLSKYLNDNYSKISKICSINLSKVFPGTVKASMLNVHLYFLKVFGCQVVESGAPLPINEIAKSIVCGKAYEHIYIAFGANPAKSTINHSGQTQIHSVNHGNVSVFASWMYVVDKIGVNIVYANQFKDPKVMKNTWHPTTVTKTLKLKVYK